VWTIKQDDTQERQKNNVLCVLGGMNKFVYGFYFVIQVEKDIFFIMEQTIHCKNNLILVAKHYNHSSIYRKSQLVPTHKATDNNSPWV
jgi:hypothetical protein